MEGVLPVLSVLGQGGFESEEDADGDDIKPKQDQKDKSAFLSFAAKHGANGYPYV